MRLSPIDKPCIFVTSAGRTGTRFFGTLFQRIIDDCKSFHEPDVMIRNNSRKWWFAIRNFGLMRSTIGKVTPAGNFRALGIGRVRGLVSDDDAIQALRRMRNRFIENAACRYYCEANLQLLHFADLLPKAFPNSHTVFIIRDPRDWVRSSMNFPTGWYTWRDFTSYFPHGRLSPRYVVHDPARRTWASMSRFEKLCWAWNANNGFTAKRFDNAENVHSYRFEDLFASEDAEPTLSELLRTVTAFPGGDQAIWKIDAGAMKEKIHASKHQGCPHWTQWPAERCHQLDQHCGHLMRRFGYGTEPEWLNLLSESRERQLA